MSQMTPLRYSKLIILFCITVFIPLIASQACLQFSGNKCILCPTGMRLFRNNCLFNIPACLQYSQLTGFDCSKCSQGFDLVSQNGNFQCVKSITQNQHKINKFSVQNTSIVQNKAPVQNRIESNFKQIPRISLQVAEITRFIRPILAKNYQQFLVQKVFKRQSDTQKNQFVYRLIFITNKGLLQIEITISADQSGSLDFSTFQASSKKQFAIQKKGNVILVLDLQADKKYSQIKAYMAKNYPQYSNSEPFMVLAQKLTNVYRIFLFDEKTGLNQVIINLTDKKNEKNGENAVKAQQSTSKKINTEKGNRVEQRSKSSKGLKLDRVQQKQQITQVQKNSKFDRSNVVSTSNEQKNRKKIEASENQGQSKQSRESRKSRQSRQSRQTTTVGFGSDKSIVQFTQIPIEQISKNTFLLQFIKFYNEKRNRSIADVKSFVSLQAYQLDLAVGDLDFIRITQLSDDRTFIQQAVYNVQVTSDLKFLTDLVIQRTIVVNRTQDERPVIDQKTKARNALEDTLAIDKFLRSYFTKSQAKEANLNSRDTQSSRSSKGQQSNTKNVKNPQTNQQNKSNHTISVNQQSQQRQQRHQRHQKELSQARSEKKQATNQNQSGFFTVQQLRDNPSFKQADMLLRKKYISVLSGASLLASKIDLKEDQKVILLQIVYDMGNQTYLVFDSVVNFQGVIQVRQIKQTKSLQFLQLSQTDFKKIQFSSINRNQSQNRSQTQIQNKAQTQTQNIIKSQAKNRAQSKAQTPNPSNSRSSNIKNRIQPNQVKTSSNKASAESSSRVANANQFTSTGFSIIPIQQSSRIAQLQFGLSRAIKQIPEIKGSTKPIQFKRIIEISNDQSKRRIVYDVIFKAAGQKDVYEARFLASANTGTFELLSFKTIQSSPKSDELAEQPQSVPQSVSQSVPQQVQQQVPQQVLQQEPQQEPQSVSQSVPQSVSQSVPQSTQLAQSQRSTQSASSEKPPSSTSSSNLAKVIVNRRNQLPTNNKMEASQSSGIPQSKSQNIKFEPIPKMFLMHPMQYSSDYGIIQSLRKIKKDFKYLDNEFKIDRIYMVPNQAQSRHLIVLNDRNGNQAIFATRTIILLQKCQVTEITSQQFSQLLEGTKIFDGRSRH